MSDDELATLRVRERGDIVLVPIKLGVGWRAGVNAGSQCFSKKRRWIPVCAGSGKDAAPAATTAAQPVAQPSS